MPKRLPTRLCFLLPILVMFSGCETTPKDYTLFEKHPPRSILVLPPLNESVDESATYGYLATITQPLAELGYYVFPVAIIDQFLKENGLPTPGEMHTISLDKIDEIIGADAVLYITIKEYGSKYQVISSTTIVAAEAELIDVKTGTSLWTHSVRTQSSSGSRNSVAEMLVGAIVDQIVNTKLDAAHLASRTANTTLLSLPDQGLLPGPYSEQKD